MLKVVEREAVADEDVARPNTSRQRQRALALNPTPGPEPKPEPEPWVRADRVRSSEHAPTYPYTLTFYWYGPQLHVCGVPSTAPLSPSDRS